VEPLRGVSGAPVSDVDGNRAVFSVVFVSGRIAAVDFRCTTCTTLVALCEHLAELVIGLDAQAALGIQADTLLALHPDIPDARRPGAALALAALKSAVAAHTTTRS
jgi:hypothetical protein